MRHSLIARDTDVLDAICRVDFASFIRKCFHTLSPNKEFQPNWHIYALADHLEQVRLGEITRLNVNMPPRMLKSFICSVAFPAFILGRDPSKRVIVVTYGTDLATKFGNDTRLIMESAWYRRMFPGTRISRTKNTESEFVTTANGSRLAVSIDGALTGRGGDYIIVDDPLKAADARSDSKRERVNYLFANSVVTRLDNKRTGGIVFLMQRLHPDDPVGTLLRSSSRWTTLAFPAIAERDEYIRIGKNQYHHRRVGDVLHPEREPRSDIERMRSEMTPEDFAAQYQQSPVLPGGTMFKRSWIHRYDQWPRPPAKVIQSWDTASKDGELNDYSVCTTVLYQQQNYYVIDVIRERLDFPALRTRAIAHAREQRAHTILIEDAGVGTALVSELKRNGLPAVGVKPQESKKIRASVQAEKFESGRVFLPEKAPWLADFEAELFAFPRVRHDDQVDSLVQILASDIASNDPGAIAAGYDNFVSRLLFG
jgi:predicted phage terminase large subunit-like protein